MKDELVSTSRICSRAGRNGQFIILDSREEDNTASLPLWGCDGRLSEKAWVELEAVRE